MRTLLAFRLPDEDEELFHMHCLAQGTLSQPVWNELYRRQQVRERDLAQKARDDFAQGLPVADTPSNRAALGMEPRT